MTQRQIDNLKDRLTTLKSTHVGNLNRRVGNLERKVREIQHNLVQTDEFINTFVTQVEQKINSELAAIMAQVSSGSYSADSNNTPQADLNNAWRRRKKRQKTKRRKRKRKGTRKKS